MALQWSYWNSLLGWSLHYSVSDSALGFTAMVSLCDSFVKTLHFAPAELCSATTPLAERKKKKTAV